MKHRLAVQQFENGLTEEAIKTAEEAIGLETQAIDPYLLLARAYLENGNPPKAQQVIEQAHRIAPDHAEVEYTHGTIEERSQRLDAALAHFERACALDPEQMDYLVARAECLVSLDRADEAYELLALRLGMFPSDGTLETLLAEVAVLLGRGSDAAARFRTALDVVGENESLAEQYGLLLLRLNRPGEAVGVLKPLVDGRGEEANGAAVRGLAASYLKLDRADEAQRLLRDYTSRHREDEQGWLLFAHVSLTNKDLPTARRCADELTRLAPRDPQVSLIQAYVCWRQDRPDDARRALESALRALPDDVLAHCLMGEVLAQSNQIEQSRDHYRRALQMDPTCAWARAKVSAY